MKLFVLSVSARKTSKEPALSYKSSLNAYDLLRQVVIEHLAEHDDPLKGELEVDESDFGRGRKGKSGRGAGHKQSCSESWSVAGSPVSILPDVKAESLMNETVRKIRGVQSFTHING